MAISPKGTEMPKFVRLSKNAAQTGIVDKCLMFTVSSIKVFSSANEQCLQMTNDSRPVDGTTLVSKAVNIVAARLSLGRNLSFRDSNKCEGSGSWGICFLVRQCRLLMYRGHHLRFTTCQPVVGCTFKRG
ncbi:hypothetical protein M514_15235 [Trichuris suis]|uniref:Uncharacterized protein n=1 Tax=Trichuris suis TaxID=68888 RepID=A0A085NSF3_9BILA|nr:hypothetical protein M514_15235 [Trichuris suis]